jgi:hypothetical protein
MGETAFEIVDFILTRGVSEGLLLSTRKQLSLTHVSGCESPLNQHSGEVNTAGFQPMTEPWSL